MPKGHCGPLTTGATPGVNSGTSDLSLAATFSTDPIWWQFADSGSIQLTTPSTGSPVGTATIEYSNDPCDSQNGSPTGPTPATGWAWTTVAGSSTAISGSTGSPFYFDLTKVTARWVRLTYTRTSGTGTATGNFDQKGPG